MRALLVIALLLAGCERVSDSAGAGAGSAATPVTVPPPVPGEPSIGADREVMLQKFAANISQGIYTHANLLFLLCNSEAGRAVANQAGEPMTMALMRRMTALFRSAPGMAHAACPSPPPQTP